MISEAEFSSWKDNHRLKGNSQKRSKILKKISRKNSNDASISKEKSISSNKERSLNDGMPSAQEL